MSAPATPSRGRSSSARATGKDNLYVCSILAVHVDTGELKWHYQVVPGDIWDFDSVQHLMLADLTINGRAAQSDHAGEQERVLLRARSAHRAVHLGRTVLAGHLGQGDRSEDRPADRQSGGALRHRADHDLAGRRRRAQLVADVVQSRRPVSTYIPTSTFNSFDLRGGADVRPAAGPHDRHRPAGADRRPRRRRRRSDPSRSKDREDEARWSPGIRWRSRCAGAARRRRHRRRHDDHGGQSGVSDDQRRTSGRLQRRQGREAAGDPDRPAQRHGTADHLSAGRQAVRGVDGRRRRGRRRQRRPGKCGDTVLAQAADVRPRRQGAAADRESSRRTTS